MIFNFIFLLLSSLITEPVNLFLEFAMAPEVKNLAEIDSTFEPDVFNNGKLLYEAVLSCQKVVLPSNLLPNFLLCFEVS